MRITPLVAAATLLFGPWIASPAAEPPLDVAEAKVETVAREQLFDAVIEAVHQATVSAQTSGRILEVNFDVDDYVSKDDVIIRFRDKEQRAAVNAAQARFAEAEANFERMRGLLERKLVSKAEFDKAEAAVKAARAALEQAQEQLEYTRVRAPYSGIVVQRHVEPGEMASPGQPLMTGLSLERLRATANVSQPYIDELRKRGQARVMLPVAGGGLKVVESRSVTVSPYADPKSHTFRVRVDLPEGPHGVYPGMFAKVAFAVGESQRLLIPSEAVVHRSEVTAVYVVGEEGNISFRQIRVGRERDGKTAVLAGLSEGEKVALDPIRAGVYLKQSRAGGGQ